LVDKDLRDIAPRDIPALVQRLQKEMKEAARKLEFEHAATLRDMIFELEQRVRQRVRGHRYAAGSCSQSPPRSDE
ncbi:MAG: UvrB/UvrC motif-containing protein, partial [Chloroflexi bacterium]|nr:UvrB/UvrC motif-containing protein [Chloroflexota bacterium]